MSACPGCGREMHGEPCRFCVVDVTSQAEQEKLQAKRLGPLADMIDKVGLSHEREKALMAKERHAIVAWLRRLAGDTNPIAKLIEDGQHWKDQP